MMPDAMPIFRQVAAALLSDEALAPLADPPATATIDVLGAKAPGNQLMMPD
jgi:hypothetical protein